MGDVTNLQKFRRLRESSKVPGGMPTIVIEAWVGADGDVHAGTYSLLHADQLGSPSLARDAAFLAFRAADYTAVSLSEHDSPGAWAAEPVYQAALIRGGHTSGTHNLFWHREAHVKIGGRLRCAWWATQAGADMAWQLVRRILQLVFLPDQLRELPIEDREV